MPHEVAPQFARSLAVLRLLPTAERLCRTDWQAGVGAERVEQAICGEPVYVAAIPAARVGVDRSRRQPDLRHRERLGARRDIVAFEFDFALEGIGLRNQLAAEIAGRGGRLLGVLLPECNRGASQRRAEFTTVHSHHFLPALTLKAASSGFASAAAFSSIPCFR